MESFLLRAVIEKKDAVRLISEHQNNLVIKWQKLFKKNHKKLTSIEMLYLPYWCFDYEYHSKQVKDTIKGKVAVETTKNLTAILPDGAELLSLSEVLHKGGLPLLTVKGDPDPEVARETIYWEAFAKEKKRKDIKIEITNSSVLYVPYWIGYLQGEKIEIIAVDATTGKIDLGIKDAFLMKLVEK
ncbi:hypothetical protein BKP37_01360 [Anaerobacillus alkalilacustris]|uniref:Uncharacterized protein n=1 Tax=Anaerobacillus alkalilacustris TaxID=393763 RepID=A0A1S2LZR5_9BACI|nr:hypothetical protein [Anaerobacillus alkalilacustris]OIJ17207.1 hypothetical protein BKP37_01360 [Anaerobacillus alkalilacustris]